MSTLSEAELQKEIEIEEQILVKCPFTEEMDLFCSYYPNCHNCSVQMKT